MVGTVVWSLPLISRPFCTLLFRYGGFLSFIENRELERFSERATKEWKHCAVQTIVRAPELRDVPDSGVVFSTLHRMVLEGPLFLPARAAAMEVL